VARDELHVSVGGLLEVDQGINQGDFGKEGMHKEINSWKEEQHTHMHKIPNNVRVKDFAMDHNG
jgi:hypothetical protein